MRQAVRVDNAKKAGWKGGIDTLKPPFAAAQVRHVVAGVSMKGCE